MMKKRIMILISLFLVTTGCSVNYEVTLDDNLLSEVLKITENQDSLTSDYKDLIDNIYNLPQPVYTDADVNPYDETQIIEGVEYYQKNMISSQNEYGIEIKYNHSLNEYEKSNIINRCYKNVTVLRDGNNITLSTSRNNLCFDIYDNLEEINIIINFDAKKYEVITHNADQKEEGKYSWNINSSNYNDKSIVIELEEKQIKNDEYYAWGLAGFIFITVVCLLVVYLVARKKNQNKNKI